MSTERSRPDAEQNLDGATKRSPVAGAGGTFGSVWTATWRVLQFVAVAVALGAVVVWTAFWGSVAHWHVIHAEFVGLGMTLVLIAIPFGLLAWHFELGTGAGRVFGGVWKGRKAGR